ncbi:hypothetical protein B0T24DRAFT_679266 [Lasiosphaeria ovina]|uniref:Uncharacterized protein n=1 Tax=Lasiosphaeria ovina TaxID=92902 RepID=A0AAE0N886_9PEZI|nr:hypothetical protein B0T24DRAFT_679266 [Lasiosphaeria ovina]
MAVSVAARVQPQWPHAQTSSSRRAELVLLREGVDIALAYFNYEDEETLPILTAKARKWSEKYYRGYPYASRRAIALIKAFPNLFNLNVKAYLRLTPAAMPRDMELSNQAEPENASPRHLRRVERKVMNSEAFPEFTEPTLASPDELDEIVDLRPRQRRSDLKTKPVMRVDALGLRDSGLLRHLPEFLGQLARANLETETLLANSPSGVGFELDDTTAQQQPHIEMDVYAGLVETQRRRHARRIVLPGGRPFKPSGDDDNDDDRSSSGSSGAGDAAKSNGKSEDSDTGNESDASTSTTASLRAKTKKRKAGAMSGPEDSSPPNKLRIQYSYPPPILQSFDIHQRKMVKKINPAAGPDPFNALGQIAVPSSPTLSTSSQSSSSSGGQRRIIKIKVPSSSSSSSSSADNSRASTPDQKQCRPSSTSPSRVIRLRDPRSSPSSSSSSASSSARSSQFGSIPIIKLKVPKRPAPSISAPVHSGGTISSDTDSSTSTSSSSSTSADGAIPTRPSTSGSDTSSSSRRVKIKVIKRSGPGYEQSENKRRLIEEVSE